MIYYTRYTFARTNTDLVVYKKHNRRVMLVNPDLCIFIERSEAATAFRLFRDQIVKRERKTIR